MSDRQARLASRAGLLYNHPRIHGSLGKGNLVTVAFPKQSNPQPRARHLLTKQSGDTLATGAKVGREAQALQVAPKCAPPTDRAFASPSFTSLN